MAVNLPPQYHDAEDRYRKAKTNEDKLSALKEMWTILPKHKASEKVQADLKSRISELNDRLEQEKLGPKKAAPGTFRWQKQGAGLVILCGPPNAGKSSLLAKFTQANPAIAPYPFTTREPMPGMMDFEDVRIQLIDLPPITAEMYDHQITDLSRVANSLLLFLDLADDEGLEATRVVIDRLKQARRDLVAELPDVDEDPTRYAVRTLLLANKCDDDAAELRWELLREEWEIPFPVHHISTERGDGLDELKKAIYHSLQVMRIYTKLPGKPPDMNSPFVCPIGSTVHDFSAIVHNDFYDKLKSARLWRQGSFDGQIVGREEILQERDIVELHI